MWTWPETQTQREWRSLVRKMGGTKNRARVSAFKNLKLGASVKATTAEGGPERHPGVYLDWLVVRHGRAC